MIPIRYQRIAILLLTTTRLTSISSYNPSSSYNSSSSSQQQLQQRRFERAGGILYKTGVLSSQEFETIREEVGRITQFTPERSSIATLRTGATLPPSSQTYQILSSPNGALSTIIQHITASNPNEPNETYEMSTQIPLEIRNYETVGSGMSWHKDDVLFDPPQIEVVLTLHNGSDCRTMWKEESPSLAAVAADAAANEDTAAANADTDTDTENKRKTKLVEVETEPNSAVFLRAGGVEHCVSSLKRGNRTILKLAFVRKGAVLVEDVAEEVLGQFGGSSRGKNGKNGSSRKVMKKRR